MKDTVVIDEAWLHASFDTFNRLYFDNALPRPRLSLSQSRTRLGSMSCKHKLTWRGYKSYQYAIHVSTYYNQTERQYQNVLLHEMIHYYIAYKGIVDTSPHGKIFRQMMKNLNEKYGWEISVSSRISEAKPASVQSSATPRLILLLEVQGRGHFVSVVNPKYVSVMEHELQRLSEVKQHAWYLSSDAYFDSFPVVRSLRGRRITVEMRNEIIAKLTPLKQV